MVDELAGNIERGGHKGFSIKSANSIGRRSTKEAPDLNKFDELVKNIELDDMCKKQLSTVKEYYSKYKL